MSMRFDIPDQSPTINFSLDGKMISALKGDTIASALYASGIREWRRSHRGDRRGILCGMGICFDCLVTVDGQPNQRACQTIVIPGMIVETNLKDK